MSDNLLIVVRCAKAPARNYHFIFRTPADEGSSFFQRQTDMEWVEQIDEPVRIDISSNWLTDVDLSLLESCKSLEYLSLAVNKFETLDLTPLQKCKSLKHLDISHNKLTNIDLTPLAGCKSLTYLYMQNNMLSRVNVAPLLQLKDMTTAVIQLTHHNTHPKLVIDSFMSNVPPNLNDILFAFFTGRKTGFVPEWLYDKNTEIEYSPRSYRDLVNEFGWAPVKKHLMALSRKMQIKTEFVGQKILLDAFGMPELACYDGRVRDFVKFLPTHRDYDKGIQEIYSKMVKLLEGQLERGGSTLYFDLDILSTTPGSVLLPSVLSRRDAEMNEVTLFDRSGNVDLFPLWLTSYGHKILTALGIKRYVPKSRLSEINTALKKINHELAIENVANDAREKKSQKFTTGNVILSHVRQIVAR